MTTLTVRGKNSKLKTRPMQYIESFAVERIQHRIDRGHAHKRFINVHSSDWMREVIYGEGVHQAKANFPTARASTPASA